MFAIAQQRRLAADVQALVFYATASNSGLVLMHVFHFKDFVKNTIKSINARMPTLYLKECCVHLKNRFGDTTGSENTLLTKF